MGSIVYIDMPPITCWTWNDNCNQDNGKKERKTTSIQQVATKNYQGYSDSCMEIIAFPPESIMRCCMDAELSKSKIHENDQQI